MPTKTPLFTQLLYLKVSQIWLTYQLCLMKNAYIVAMLYFVFCTLHLLLKIFPTCFAGDNCMFPQCPNTEYRAKLEYAKTNENTSGRKKWVFFFELILFGVNTTLLMFNYDKRAVQCYQMPRRLIFIDIIRCWNQTIPMITMLIDALNICMSKYLITNAGYKEWCMSYHE